MLPVFRKILEKLMHKRLMSFILKFKLLFKYLFGFQQNNSTIVAVLSICSHIINAIENKEKACCIFLDFAKAFDTVDHDILIDRIRILLNYQII